MLQPDGMTEHSAIPWVIGIPLVGRNQCLKLQHTSIEGPHDYLVR